jgi:hypothetical protein
VFHLEDNLEHGLTLEEVAHTVTTVVSLHIPGGPASTNPDRESRERDERVSSIKMRLNGEVPQYRVKNMDLSGACFRDL